MQITQILLVYLLWVGRSERYFRLENSGDKLTEQDELVSTLGHFRVRLVEEGCQLRVEQFRNNNYRSVGRYPNKKHQHSCDSVFVSSAGLQSSNNELIIQLAQPQPNAVLIVNIDDMGVLRLISSHSLRNKQVSEELWVSDFRQPQEYVYATSNMIATMGDTLSFRRNKGGWGISALHGQLRLFLLNDTQKIVRYNYRSFSITPSQILDEDNLPPPRATFEDFNYQPKCWVSSYLDIQFPIVFYFHPYWPELRVLDQSGYQLLAVRYPHYNCIDDLGLNDVPNHKSCSPWVCPPETYEHKGECVLVCPEPYFHQRSPYQRHRCVLNCEEHAIVNTSERLCACKVYEQHICPENTEYYTLGCACKVNYYDGVRCSERCPLGMMAIKGQEGGVCVSCPHMCQRCKPSNQVMSAINYLQCTKCYDGYSIHEGVCKSSCSALVSMPSCPKCVSQHCQSCSSPNICTSCTKPYILFHHECVESCPEKHMLKATNNMYICYEIPSCTALIEQPLTQHIKQCKKCGSYTDFCWISCDLVTFFRTESECYCVNAQQYSYVEYCQQERGHCSLKEYLSPYGECLPCPFGCLSCLQDFGGFVECTSCAPSYYLVLDLQWGHYCQTYTLLTSCINANEPTRFFHPSQLICDFGNQLSHYNHSMNRIKCYSNIPHCLTCQIYSATYCTYCSEGTYLYTGECYEECPKNTFIYQRSCIYIELEHCEEATIISMFSVININMDVQQLDGYEYLLPKNEAGKNERIDPVGKIFFYAFLANKMLQGNRQGFFDRGKMVCSRCQEGYGINLDGECLPCRQRYCSMCLNSIQNKCSICYKNYKLNENSVCIEKSPEERQCEEGQWRWMDGRCRDFCYGYYVEGQHINCTYTCKGRVQEAQEQSDYLLCREQEKQREYIRLAGTLHKMNEKTVIIYLTPQNAQFSLKSVSHTDHTEAMGHSILTSTSTTSQNITAYISQHLLAFVVQGWTGMVEIELKVGRLHNNHIYLANSLYGFTDDTVSYDQLLDKNIAFYGRIYVLVVVILTIVYIGDGQLYKTDNLMLYCQSLYLALLSMDLQVSEKDLYRFLYGFKWSVGSVGTLHPYITVPSYLNGLSTYIEQARTTAHYLLNVDNNIIRNCTFLFVFLLMVGVMLFVLFVLVDTCLGSCYPGLKHTHRHKLSNTMIFVAENSLAVFSYYSVSNLTTQEWVFSSYRTGMFKGLSVIVLLFVVVGFGVRLRQNKVAGIYWGKRIVMGVFMAILPVHALFWLGVMELGFCLIRVWYQQLYISKNPYIKYIVVEEVLLVIGWVILSIGDLLPWLSVSVLCCILNYFIAALILELVMMSVELYRASKPGKDREKAKMKVDRIRTLWDHSLNTSTDQLNTI